MEWDNIINVYEATVEIGKPVESAPHYQSGSSHDNSKKTGAEQIVYDIRVIPPGKMAVPYHFHRKNEELFLILEGEATLRQNDRKRIVSKGDLILFKTGPQGAHQLLNHTQQNVRYLDMVSRNGDDVCEYPDSDKINCGMLFQKKDQVDYFKGEEKPASFWDETEKGPLE